MRQKKTQQKQKNIVKIWSYNWYGMKTVFEFSKGRVICAVLCQLISYILWVFYSAYFIRFVIQTMEQECALNEILRNIAIIGGVSLLLQGFLYLCSNVLFPLQDIRIHQKMYQRIYRKSENVELACYENTEFYNRFSIALDGMGKKLGRSVDIVSQIVGGTIAGIIACYSMIEIDPWMILFLIAPLIGNFIFAPKMNHISYQRYKDGVPHDRKIGYVNRVMYLNKYAKELRLYNIFRVMKQMFSDATKSKSEIWKKYYKKAMGYGILQYIFSYVIIFEGILLYGAYRAMIPNENPITFSEMAVLTSVMIAASWIWVGVIDAFNKGTETGLALADLKDFLEYEETIPENTDGILPEKIIETIEFRDVSFSYDGKKAIINHLSFQLKQGEKLALVGHNGAGKSTIIKLLLRLYDPTEGIVLVNGRDIREYNLRAYRESFLCAFQDYQIFAGTVKDNILLGREGSDEQVEEALRKAGILEKIQSLPCGMDTMLTKEFDDKGVVLSGGEYQKISCARVFLDNTKLSVFDEPSSALDPISENELFRNIMQSVTDRICILISHRLSSVREADVVFMLENGSIVEYGTHESLMQQNGLYASMYRVQEKNYFALDDAKEEVSE